MFLPPGRDSPIPKQVFVEWMDILLQSFHQGRRQSLTKSILTLIAQIHLENTKEDTEQKKNFQDSTACSHNFRNEER